MPDRSPRHWETLISGIVLEKHTIRENLKIMNGSTHSLLTFTLTDEEYSLLFQRHVFLNSHFITYTIWHETLQMK